MGLLRRRRDPAVSVVVPAYGVESYLPACLDSLLAQTWTTWEAIIVDDGSPDGSVVGYWDPALDREPAGT